MRSLPAAHRPATRNIPEPESARRRTGGAAVVRQPGWPHLAARHSRLLWRIRYVALWINKDGALVGASPGIIATSQSAFMAEPENGWYDVWIAYDPTYNVAPFVEYQALAEVEDLPAAGSR